jgi:hypothetical protein
MKHFPIPETINIENLEKMAQYVENLPQSVFDMNHYRYGTYGEEYHFHKECRTTGCILGHCTILDIKPLPMKENGIDFSLWCYHFTGINPFLNLDIFDFLFSGKWKSQDNTPQGAAQRIRYFLEYGLPENWYQQMTGNAPLTYLETNKNK